MRNSARTLLYVGLAWLFNALLAFAILLPRIQGDLERESNELLIQNGYPEWKTRFSGVDAILLGPELPRGADKHPEEDGVRLALEGKVPGLHSILDVQYGATEEALLKSSTKREYFIITQLGNEISVRGDFSSVSERADVSQALRDMFGATSVRELGTVNNDLMPFIDADVTVRKMAWMKELEGFIFDFDGKRVDLSGQATSPDRARAIGVHIRLLFGKSIPVINRLTVDGKQVEAPPGKASSRAKSAFLTQPSQSRIFI